MKLRLTILIMMCLSLSSCNMLFTNYLLRPDPTYQYFEMAETLEAEHILEYGDVFSFTVFTREGFELVDVLERGVTAGGGLDYEVQEDGFVELPILGEVYVAGLTKSELENLLEEKYSRLYNEPYVRLTIENRRVFFFGGGGSATVIELSYEKTTLLEFMAMAGGVASNSKSSKIRLIRGDMDHPRIKIIDLSTINGLQEADIIMQSNDIVAVESTTKVIPELLREISPILSLITTATTIYLLIVNLSR